MKLKDFIINENLIDSKFDIERAVLNKSNSTVNIFIKIENVLSYEGYVSLENKVKDFFDKMRLTSKLNVNYSNNDLTGKLEAYLDAIVKDITRRAPRFHILKLDMDLTKAYKTNNKAKSVLKAINIPAVKEPLITI